MRREWPRGQPRLLEALSSAQDASRPTGPAADPQASASRTPGPIKQPAADRRPDSPLESAQLPATHPPGAPHYYPVATHEPTNTHRFLPITHPILPRHRHKPPRLPPAVHREATAPTRPPVAPRRANEPQLARPALTTRVDQPPSLAARPSTFSVRNPRAWTPLTSFEAPGPWQHSRPPCSTRFGPHPARFVHHPSPPPPQLRPYFTRAPPRANPFIPKSAHNGPVT